MKYEKIRYPDGQISVKLIREVFDSSDSIVIKEDPITDDGTKKSKKGLLRVTYDETDNPQDRFIVCDDQCTWEEEGQGLLTTVFKDGKMINKTTLQEIRDRLA